MRAGSLKVVLSIAMNHFPDAQTRMLQPWPGWIIDDDNICRWVVWHYRYDPDRGQRRNVVVAPSTTAVTSRPISGRGQRTCVLA